MSATKDAIIKLPNPHLRERSKKVGLISEEIKALVKDMESSALDWEESRNHEVSVALAAIQIDQPIRVIIIRKNFDDKTNKEFSVFINPEVVKYEGEVKEDYEGCLSIESIYGKVPRHTKVKIKALGLDGKQIRVTAEGFLARVFQHEIDHTNGKVFIDHIKDSPEAFHRLDEDGKLEALNYAKDIKNNSNLWN